MSEATLPVQTGMEVPVKTKNAVTSSLLRVGRYMAVRIVTLGLTVVVAVYLTIMIANMGGFVDKIRRGTIRENVGMAAQNDPAMKQMAPAERTRLLEARIALEENRLGLNTPFMVRSVTYLKNALVLDLGRSQNMSSSSGSRQVRLIILERLPTTLVLFGTANIVLFFVEITIALTLSRRYGSFFDKMFVTASPLSTAPGWFYGIFLILIFAALLHWLPFGGMVDAPPPENKLDYALSMLKHMILPIVAITFNSIFLATYNWRTFFLIYSSEDYVDVAKAKGLSSRAIERRYILRPTLPFIITTFALGLVFVWSGAPIFETVFQWPGLGRRLIEAVRLFDTPVIVAEVVLFSYLLAITVFLLEFVYALVDPRVKVGGSGSGQS
jgi:peptide/nickel transport system permease protein